MGLTAAGKKRAMKRCELKAAVLDFKTMALLHFLGDITEQLNVVSKSLQGDIPDIKQIFMMLDGLISSLSTNYPECGPIRWGPRTRAFLSKGKDLGTATPGPIQITPEHEIKVTAKA